VTGLTGICLLKKETLKVSSFKSKIPVSAVTPATPR
jgi:hypothetical protein